MCDDAVPCGSWCATPRRGVTLFCVVFCFFFWLRGAHSMAALATTAWMAKQVPAVKATRAVITQQALVMMPPTKVRDDCWVVCLAALAGR